ncbi:MAG TPA: PH domain-containing protein [Streptosporangiaceae bacterium]|nr:PH domain-containing protein [Streptosporangiaceae bacterium]
MQTYRNPPWSLVIQVVLLSIMALIAVSIAIHPGDTGDPGTAPGYIACGSVIAALFLFMIVALLASRLVVSAEGISWRSVVRTRSIAWDDIQDVVVVPASSVGPWYSPAVKTDGRLVRINSVIGPRRYAEGVVAAVVAARAAGQHTGVGAKPA